MLLEMMESIRAQEDAELAQIIGLFTRQAGSKEETRRLNRARQRWFRRKSRIARRPFTTPVPVRQEKREKLDLSAMSKEEKREYLEWLKERGIRVGNG